MTAGRRSPARRFRGRNSWPWTITPSEADTSTGCGSTSAASGKSAGIAPAARSRAGPEPTIIAGRGGLRASARRSAIALPSLVTAGAHSMPVPLVTACGRPPATLTRRDPDERERRAVGGPHVFAVVVDACVEKLERLRGHVIHADKAVVSAATHKRELRAVGGPAERLRAAARVHELLGLRAVGERRPPDLSLVEKGHAIAFRGDGGRVALTQAARRTARGGDDPERLLDARGQRQRVRVLAPSVGGAATHVDERPCVGCPGEFPDLLPIVFLVARHRAALVLGAGRDPDVAHALRVEDPGERSTRRRSHELVGKRRGERLLDRERALLGAGGAGREYEGGQARSRARGE